MTKENDQPPHHHEGSALTKPIRGWLSPEVYIDLCELVMDESEWVCGAIHDSPAELLSAYGLDIDEDNYYHDKNKVPMPVTKDAHQVVGVLRENNSWGEFIGGVVASFPVWNMRDRDIVKPQLEATIMYAAAHGVDH